MNHRGHLGAFVPHIETVPASGCRRGWRVFKCDTCHVWWWIPTRDHSSPSVESCPTCNADLFPQYNESDDRLECDEMGNLVNPPPAFSTGPLVIPSPPV